MPMIGVVLVLMLEVGETLVFECSLPIKTTAATISISKDDNTHDHNHHHLHSLGDPHVVLLMVC